MFAVNDAPLFHDRVDLLNVVNIGQGVGIEDDEVGEFAGFKRTEIFKSAAGDSAVFCAGDDGLRGVMPSSTGLRWRRWFRFRGPALRASVRGRIRVPSPSSYRFRALRRTRRG